MIEAPPFTLMQFWRLHRDECRPIGPIVAEARSGKLAGVEPAPHGHGFNIINSNAAFAAMRKGLSS